MDYAIIAAGEGSRLVQEGVTTPKPLIRLAGTPMVDRLINIFLRNGADSVSIIVNEEMREVQAHLRELQLPVPFNLHIRSTPSSMHSFYELTRYLTGDSVCLTTVDTIFHDDEFARYVAAFRAETALDGMMAVTGFIDDEKPLYVRADADGTIRGFEDAPSDCCYVSGGIYCLRRKCIDTLERAIGDGAARMRNYQRRLVADGLRLKSFPFSKIIDVDHADDVAKAENFLADHNPRYKA